MKTPIVDKESIIEVDIATTRLELEDFIEELRILEKTIPSGQTKTTLNLQSEQARH